jgi:hypothetical protein
MPNKNHINVNVKNVIKLDHNKKKTRRRRKNKNNKNIPMPLVRSNNSVYVPNAITYQTGGGGSIQYPINKSTYDTKPRIGFGIDPNETNSTNMTQQLLLEHQKKNDDKTKQMFSDYRKEIVDGLQMYHDRYYEPLKDNIHILQSDFDSYKTSTYPIYQQPALPEHYSSNLLKLITPSNNDTNIIMDKTKNNAYNDYFNFEDNPSLNYNSIYNRKDPINNDKDINNSRFETYNPAFNEVMLNQPETIYNSNNADNFDDKEGYPILTSNNADNFQPPAFNNTNLNEDFDVESVDEDEDDLPKNDAILEEKTFAIYFSQIKDPKILYYINKTDPRLGIINVPLGIGGGAFNLLLQNKLKQSKNTKIKGLRFNIPARYFTEEQIKKLEKPK